MSIMRTPVHIAASLGHSEAGRKVRDPGRGLMRLAWSRALGLVWFRCCLVSEES